MDLKIRDLEHAFRELQHMYLPMQVKTPLKNHFIVANHAKKVTMKNLK